MGRIDPGPRGSALCGDGGTWAEPRQASAWGSGTCLCAVLSMGTGAGFLACGGPVQAVERPAEMGTQGGNEDWRMQCGWQPAPGCGILSGQEGPGVGVGSGRAAVSMREPASPGDLLWDTAGWPGEGHGASSSWAGSPHREPWCCEWTQRERGWWCKGDCWIEGKWDAWVLERGWVMAFAGSGCQERCWGENGRQAVGRGLGGGDPAGTTAWCMGGM
jgi:hypothetical protein